MFSLHRRKTSTSSFLSSFPRLTSFLSGGIPAGQSKCAERFLARSAAPIPIAPHMATRPCLERGPFEKDRMVRIPGNGKAKASSSDGATERMEAHLWAPV